MAARGEMQEGGSIVQVSVMDRTTNQTVRLQLDDASRLVDVKEQVSAITGTPSEYVQLSYAGRYVDPETPLVEINKQSTGFSLMEWFGAPSSTTSYIDMQGGKDDSIQLDLTYTLNGGCFSEVRDISLKVFSMSILDFCAILFP